MRIAPRTGAISMARVPLHLRGEVRGIWFDWLRMYRPDLIPRYEELYKRGAYVPSEERKRLAADGRQRAPAQEPPARPPAAGHRARPRRREDRAAGPKPAQRQESLF